MNLAVLSSLLNLMRGGTPGTEPVASCATESAELSVVEMHLRDKACSAIDWWTRPGLGPLCNSETECLPPVLYDVSKLVLTLGFVNAKDEWEMNLQRLGKNKPFEQPMALPTNSTHPTSFPAEELGFLNTELKWATFELLVAWLLTDRMHP